MPDHLKNPKIILHLLCSLIYGELSDRQDVLWFIRFLIYVLVPTQFTLIPFLFIIRTLIHAGAGIQQKSNENIWSHLTDPINQFKYESTIPISGKGWFSFAANNPNFSRRPSELSGVSLLMEYNTTRNWYTIVRDCPLKSQTRQRRVQDLLKEQKNRKKAGFSKSRLLLFLAGFIRSGKSCCLTIVQFSAGAPGKRIHSVLPVNMLLSTPAFEKKAYRRYWFSFYLSYFKHKFYLTLELA